MSPILAQVDAAAAAPQTYGQTIDFVVIIVYFALVLGFGSFFGRFSKSTRDFFFSGQRFSWWLIAMSMAATGIGSYSFLKYSLKGYEYGMSSSMTYMNDWFFQPFFMFGWLPIIYFSRVRSIPEYFERRFDTKSRFMAVIFSLMYMLGYIGYNIYTVGKVGEQLFGIDLHLIMCIMSVVSAIYITAGGQTAVIFTDLMQGFMLFLAGLTLFILGLLYLGNEQGVLAGLETFWGNLTLSQRLPFAQLSKPPDFNTVGVFWQDGVASSISFLFISQGLIMRFLAAKSMTEGRRTIFFNTLFILPFSMIVVGCGGWLGAVLAKVAPETVAGTEPSKIFVVVADLVCAPGVFGFVLAALTAALMSTIDTLTNACAAVFIYDVYQPYLAKNRSDRHYFRAARMATVCTSVVALAVAFIFAYSKGDLYTKHATMIGIISPPIVVAVFLGALWRRFTPTGAFAAMLGGMLFNIFSLYQPQLVRPFTSLHGMEPVADNFGYMRSFFGLTVAGIIGVVASLCSRPKPEHDIAGLWIGSVNLGRMFFKGREPNFEPGKNVVTRIQVSTDGTSGQDTPPTPAPDAPASQPAPQYPVVRLSGAHMDIMKAREGDVLYIGDARRWLGGLRSLHARAGTPHTAGDVLLITEDSREHGSLLPNRPVRIEKLL